MWKHTLRFAPVLALGMFAQPASAQVSYHYDVNPRFAIEASGAVGIPTEKVANVDLKTGVNVEGALRYRFLPNVSVYGGWDWDRFQPKDPVGDVDNLQGMGFTYGLRFDQPMMNNRSTFWVRAGGLANQVRVENAAGDRLSDNDYNAGWEAGAGFGIRLADRWQLTPSARYRSLERDLSIDGSGIQKTKLNYVALGLGLQFRAW